MNENDTVKKFSHVKMLICLNGLKLYKALTYNFHHTTILQEIKF